LTPAVDGFLARRRKDRRSLPPFEGRQLRPQAVDARPAMRDDCGHRNAQRRRQRLDVDASASDGQLVTHSQRQQARQIEPQHLADQQDRATQCGDVGDQYHRVRPIYV
jgi:hypothetical protein